MKSCISPTNPNPPIRGTYAIDGVRNRWIVRPRCRKTLCVNPQPLLGRLRIANLAKRFCHGKE